MASGAAGTAVCAVLAPARQSSLGSPSVLHRGASAEVRSLGEAVSDDSDELAESKGLVHDCTEAGRGADLRDGFAVGGDENDRKV